MAVEASFVAVVTASMMGLGLSVVLERLMTPRPALARPWAGWALHSGLWFSAHALMTLALARPWFAAAVVSACVLVLVLVNNAKYRSLNEPFVFQDYEYFTDAIRHPRLYIPFLGWAKFGCAVAGFVVAILVGFLGESAPADRFMWSGQLGAALLVLASGIVLVAAGNARRLAVTFDAERDLATLGFAAALWRYRQAEKAQPALRSPYAAARPAADDLPDLVAVQSESFFDPRTLYSGIRPEILDAFDRLRRDAVAHGKLVVPAWGANTVRTEFSFLSGIDAAGLGVHRFNPYRAIAQGCDVVTVAAYLKRLGYRTICIHPYPASFYQRDDVYPRFGFDEFVDIRAFDGASRAGPYVADMAVAEKIAEKLRGSAAPTFIFAITMENHGPLHLEKVDAGDIDALYSSPPPPGCDDLTIYLRHLRHANEMVGGLRALLEQSARPASLCWYGDHVPIMPKVYEMFGKPVGEVEYVYWCNRGGHAALPSKLASSDLSLRWLQDIGLVKRAA